MDTRFHCVYLLTSLDPQCEGDFYIGYTVNPLRRLRQHNGELVNGARRTRRRGRPWTLLCCVSGFTEDHAALKFEWCWQHPQESARLKHILPGFLRGLHKLPYAVGVLHLLLRARLFARLELTLHVMAVELFWRMSAIARAGGGGGGPGPGPSPAEPLPPLTPHALLHIEEITPEAFQAKYLAHDSDAASPRSARSPLSCPYDLSVLSQTVQDAWGSDATHAKAEEEGEEGGEEEGGGSGGSSPWRRSRRRREAPDRSGGTSTATTPPRGAPAEGFFTPETTPALPRRFRFYADDDFVREYARETAELRRGLRACTFCALPLRAPYILRCPRAPFCGLASHIVCLAMWMRHSFDEAEETRKGEPGVASFPASSSSSSSSSLLPTRPRPCALCGELLHWGSLLRQLRERAVREERLRANHRRVEMERRLQTRLARAHQIARGRRRPLPFSPSSSALTRGHTRRSPVREGEETRAKSISPPALIIQVKRRGRGDSPVRHRPAESIDPTEEWISEDHTLKLTDFDENEWLDY
ncbi:unnamed protein product [Phytomonas sp. EM1]|nr:unnamed protein product [Phytomonas sp. EM1]|eukprot:CCW63374.1 unnamed protein product [Phytomonas sp. isolate EM1]